MSFDPYNRSLKIRKSIGTPTPKVGVPLGVWGFIPSHSFTLLGAWNVTPEFPSWPAPLQALILVVSPRLGLWQIPSIMPQAKAQSSSTNIWYYSSCSPAALWFLLRPCHAFPNSGLGGGIYENFISTSSCALYIYVCVHPFLVD
jgi:hypothetical protein